MATGRKDIGTVRRHIRRWLSILALGVGASALAGCTDWEEPLKAFCANNPKCPENGKPIWLRAIGGKGQESAEHVALLQDGSIAVAGTYTDLVSLESQTLARGGQTDAFMAAYSADGAIKWTRSIWGERDEWLAGTVADDSGHIVVAGNSNSSSVSFGDAPNGQAGLTAAFVAKYSEAGELIWTSLLMNTGAAIQARGVAIGDGIAARDIILTGSFSGSVRLGSDELSSSSDAFFTLAVDAETGEVSRLIASGSCSPGAMRGDRVAVQSSGEVFVAAQFEGNCTVNSAPLPSTTLGSPGLVLMKFSSTGNITWISAHSEADVDALKKMDLAVNELGSAVLVASFNGAIRTGLEQYVSSRNRLSSDVLLMKFGGNGSLTWATSAGGNLDDSAVGVALSSDNHIWVTGSFQAPAEFGPLKLSTNAGVDAFLAEYDEGGEPLRALRYFGPSTETGNALMAFKEGIVLVGAFDGSFKVGVDELQGSHRDGFLTLIRFPAK
jgi:hypothetical protein